MIKLSNFPFKTLKTRPKVSDNISTSILLQAGFIRQTMAGVYSYTTLGQRVIENIKKITREELNNYGCYETYMPGLSPREIWDKTGRWDIEDYFKVDAHGDKQYRLNPTHEEIVVPLMQDFIGSYKDSETCVYQIKDKYRNEKRAKSGLLRGRDFIMKDAYSFHLTNEGFEEYYEGMKKIYMSIFERLGLGKDTYITVADGGVFTDKYSHEFQTVLPIGEDTIYIDDTTGESFNQEVAPSKIGIENISDIEMFEKQDIEHDSSIVGVEALEKLLGVPVIKTTKTLFFVADDNRFVVASLRGDYEVNTIKLRQIVGCNSLLMASEEMVKKYIGTNIGFAGIINLPDSVELYIDDSVEGMTNFETGTNRDNHHSINVNFGRDLTIPDRFYDFKDAKIGDKNPSTGIIYRVEKASEVGNIFPLETKYTKPFGMKFTDENNTEQDVIMGCYGIGISRLMGVIAEYYMTENGIAWPESVAPADYYIIVIGEENLEKANEMAIKLEQEGKSVILDDRMSKKIGFGQKAGDSELFGIPNRVVISPKTVEQGGYELTIRGKESQLIKF
ncbi:MAG: proline--tRNA ligase [Candidatus Gracilibacteria bacterium]|nr:proline--tRNA ligase [Candidatus Gracilibacteria bacterium]